MKTFRYRLYPSKAQRKCLESTLETARCFYNDCLGERKAVYELEHRTITEYEQASRVKIHKANNPYAQNVHTHILRTVVSDIQKAFDGFFRRVKAGETPGYPRFKGANRFHSFGFRECGNGFKIDGRRLRISGVGRVGVRWHRPVEGRIKTLRVVRKSNRWYACFACEVEQKPFPPAVEAEVGIDAGVCSLFTLSNGEHIENPRWYCAEQAELAKRQQVVSRRKLGGSNRRKAVRSLRRCAERVANRRKDFLHKLSRSLLTRFERIAVEDLNLAKLAGKTSLDGGWGFFGQCLSYKAENAGRTVVFVNPAYTSQDCCVCKARQAMLTEKRWYACAHCGNSRDRDENAAINILQAGRACWVRGSPLPQEAAGL
jgi:putative transposase